VLSLHQIVDPPIALCQPQTDVSGGGLVSVPVILGTSNSFLFPAFEAKHLKVLFFKICRYLGKEGILSMELFPKNAPNSLIQVTERCPLREDNQRGGQPFHPSILVMGAK